jgi:ribosome-interacting GTPase 1
LEELKRELFALSDIIRVYTKEPGHKPDLSKPFTLGKGSTMLDLCKEIHKDFLVKLRFARVWGSARFDGQKVQRDYALQDKDVVEIHI